MPDQFQLEFADSGSSPPIVTLTFRRGIWRAFGAKMGLRGNWPGFGAASVYQINPNYREAAKGQGSAGR